MLKNIPSVLSPELLKILMEMGHGDELLLADGNYPMNGHPSTVVRCDGHGIPVLLDAILKFMPLDTFVANTTTLMIPANPEIPEPAIWKEYRIIGNKYEKEGLRDLPIGRFAFYEHARKVQVVVTTGEQALCANIILKKGVVHE